MGRFKVKSGPCEYKSETCTVYIAEDRKDGKLPVALKFMKHTEEFERELKNRRRIDRSTADSLRSQVELLQQEKVRADCVHVVCVEIGSH